MDRALKAGFCVRGRTVLPLQGEIAGSGGSRHVPPKVMDVLVCLAKRAGEVVERDELLDEVWGHRYGSDRALTRCISELRRALDDEEESRIVRTIPKRGYCLAVKVEVLDHTSQDGTDPATADDKPSIAVLPFVNMSGDPDQEYFSDGITVDIITELSRHSGFLVIAKNSSFTYKGKQARSEHVSRDLGARYILEGSVVKVADRVRITAHLADGTNGANVWAEHYDRELTDVFAVQDEVTAQIASVLAVRLTASEKQRRERHRTTIPQAYDYALRGRELAWLHKRETGVEARRLLGRAIWLDPSFAAAYSWLAFTYVNDYINQWGDDPDQALGAGYELAQKAVKLDMTEAPAHFVLSVFHLWAERDHDRAMAEAELAIELDPNYSDGHMFLSQILHYAGRSSASLSEMELAMRLDPYYPDLYLHFLAEIYVGLRRYEDAVETLRSRIARNPDTDISRVLLAACYGELGLVEKARSEWEAALRVNPGYSVEHKREILPYRDRADFDRVYGGLEKAGLPTGPSRAPRSPRRRSTGAARR